MAEKAGEEGHLVGTGEDSKADSQETLVQEKCIKRYVQIVKTIVKSPSNQSKENPYTAKNVTRSIGNFSSIKPENNFLF